MLAAAQAGLGVALLRSPLVDEALLDGRLVRVSRAAIRNDAGHYLVTASGELPQATMQLAGRLLTMTVALRR